MTNASSSLGKKAVIALLWSLFQNWGVKLSSLLLFFVLARFLSAAEMGLAAAALLVLTFVNVLSEQGFIQAIVRHPELKPEDLNAPFLVSMLIAVASSVFLLGFSQQIAGWVGVPEGAGLVTLTAMIPPLVALTNFEVAMRRRMLDFGTVARAAVLASLVATTATIAMAAVGVGASSLVWNAFLIAAVTLACLWGKRIWKPGVQLAWERSRGLFAYSAKIFGSNLLNFSSTKVLDLVIVYRVGVEALGYFSVGSKIYLTLLQLLAYSLNDVSVSYFSRVLTQGEGLGKEYCRLIFLAASLAAPAFIFLALFAPEVRWLVFGDKWQGLEEVMFAMSLLGAAQVVSVINGGALAAVGKAGSIFWIDVLTLFMAVALLWTFRIHDPMGLVWIYVSSQFLVMPLSFFLGLKASEIGWRALGRSVFPCLVALAASSCLVWVGRNYAPDEWWLDYLLFPALFLLVTFFLNNLLSRGRLVSDALGFFRIVRGG